MLKIAVIGVMAVFLAIPLQKEKAEFGMLVIMAACLLLLSLSLGKMREVVDIVHRVEEYLGNSSMYVGILLKIIGITYVAEFEIGRASCRERVY